MRNNNTRQSQSVSRLIVSVRFISGTFAPHVELEERLARFHDREAAMIYSSAYAAVMGIVPQLIGERTAEAVKIGIGNVYAADDEVQSMEVKGRDLVEGVPKNLVITDEEIREAVEFSSYENMKKMERDGSFGDKSRRFSSGAQESSDAYKVRRGKIGGYRDYFTDEEATEIDALVNTTLEPGYGYTNKPAADAGTTGQAPDTATQS